MFNRLTHSLTRQHPELLTVHQSPTMLRKQWAGMSFIQGEFNHDHPSKTLTQKAPRPLGHVMHQNPF